MLLYTDISSYSKITMNTKRRNIMEETKATEREGGNMAEFMNIPISKETIKDEMKKKTFANIAGSNILDMLKDNDFYQWVGTRVDGEKWMKEYRMMIPAKKEGAE